MLINRKRPKVTLMMLFISIVYLVICCFIFFSVASVIIDLIFDGKVSLTKQSIMDVLVASTIAGTAGGLGSWVFAKIDEFKARKSPPSDPKL